jgi:hypothetical protein
MRINRTAACPNDDEVRNVATPYGDSTLGEILVPLEMSVKDTRLLVTVPRVVQRVDNWIKSRASIARDWSPFAGWPIFALWRRGW